MHDVFINEHLILTTFKETNQESIKFSQMLFPPWSSGVPNMQILWIIIITGLRWILFQYKIHVQWKPINVITVNVSSHILITFQRSQLLKITRKKSFFFDINRFVWSKMSGPKIITHSSFHFCIKCVLLIYLLKLKIIVDTGQIPVVMIGIPKSVYVKR